MTISQHAAAAPFAWIAEEAQSTEWNYVAAYGPSGYAAYVKLDFLTHESGVQGSSNGAWSPPISDTEQIAIAAALLSESGISTPTELFFCIWDGWPDLSALKDFKVEIPNRDYHLLKGTLNDLLGGWEIDGVRLPEPAFMWPTDRSWTITKDVDFNSATVALSANLSPDLLFSESRLQASRIFPYS